MIEFNQLLKQIKMVRDESGIEVEVKEFFLVNQDSISKWEKEIIDNELVNSMDKSIDRYNSFRKNMGLDKKY